MFFWMIEKNSMKLHCLKKNISTVTLEKFQNICLEIYELHAAHFLDVLESAWQPALKNIKVKLTDIDMSWTVENGIKGGIFHTI